MVPFLPLLSCKSSVSVKENPDRKKKKNIASVEKTWFITPTEKAWSYVRLFFELIIVMVKDKKIQHKRHNINQNN